MNTPQVVLTPPIENLPTVNRNVLRPLITETRKTLITPILSFLERMIVDSSVDVTPLTNVRENIIETLRNPLIIKTLISSRSQTDEQYDRQ